jgi:hypothetical protein
VRATLASIAAAFALVSTARAQPSPPPPKEDTSKLDASQLNKLGVQLLEQHQYNAALAIFKEAYGRFHSAKILLNLGTTLKLLDRKAEAANNYQRYLDSQDTDRARRDEVLAVVAELDKTVGRVHVAVTPDDAEIQIGAETEEWHPRIDVALWRVEPGEVTVRARREGYQPGVQKVAIVAGGEANVTIALDKLPPPKQIVVTVPGAREDIVRSRFGARATIVASVTPRTGAAALVGATVDALPQLEIDAGVILGPGLFGGSGMYVNPRPSVGAYVGASYAFLRGKLRPLVSARLPVFFESDPTSTTRFALRGAGGIEYVAMRQLAITIELGAEVALNGASDISGVAFVPSLAIAGRL